MKNIIFDLGGVVVEWNAKRVIETFRGNPILVNFVRENRLFLNETQEVKGVTKPRTDQQSCHLIRLSTRRL